MWQQYKQWNWKKKWNKTASKDGSNIINGMKVKTVWCQIIAIDFCIWPLGAACNEIRAFATQLIQTFQASDCVDCFCLHTYQNWHSQNNAQCANGITIDSQQSFSSATMNCSWRIDIHLSIPFHWNLQCRWYYEWHAVLTMWRCPHFGHRLIRHTVVICVNCFGLGLRDIILTRRKISSTSDLQVNSITTKHGWFVHSFFLFNISFYGGDVSLVRCY